MSSNVLNVRQIAQYARQAAVPAGSVALLQLGELGSPYGSILAQDLVATALAAGGRLQINPDIGAIVFGAGTSDEADINFVSGEFLFSEPIRTSGLNAAFIDAASITMAGVPVVTQAQLNARAIVSSFNGRSGTVMLMPEDILRAGGAPIRDAHFAGWITAPSVWDSRANDDTVATTNWVHRAIHDTGVSSFNGRTGDITLTLADINAATAAGPGFPTAPSPALGDASNRIATTLFVDESLQDLHLTISNEQLALLTSTYAPINSPNFTGVPTAPTANPGSNTGQLATTAFVHAAVTASTTGVASFNTRTGAVLLNTADITGAGGALLASPVFSGNPAAPTAAPGTNTTQLATTAFVAAAVTAAGGVSSFNTRTGAVTLSLADVTGTGVLSNTALTGVPTAPTAATATSTTQVATTAFVQAALATGVTSFMGRTGAVTLLGADVSAVGGALINSPQFTGVPTAPTPATSDSSTTLATTAFVHAAITAGAAGVTTFNGRAGAVTLTGADITGAGGALLASPTFTGTPAAPTATAGTSTTQLATTAFVQAALPGATPGWTFALASGLSTQTALNPAVLNLNGGTTFWNSADSNAMTLSNGNLTATFPSAGNGAVRGAQGFGSGKYYFESTLTTCTQTWIGVATATAALQSGAVAGQVTMRPNTGDVQTNGAFTNIVAVMPPGSVVGIAVDLTARLIWFRLCPSGNWNNSGTANPATGAGGLTLAALSGALFPIYGSSSAGDTTTANFGATAFSGTPPSGFGKMTAVDYQINNKNSGGILQILDNTLQSATPANFLELRNNITGQPSIISTLGTDTNRSIQLVPAGTGTVQAPTMATGDSSTAIATTAFVHAVAGVPVLRSYLAGLTLSTAGSSATFSVAPGVAADSTNAQMMTLAASINKTTAAWAVGTGNGSLDTGTIVVSTWYHVFLITRTDTNVVDVLISLSATAPTMPASYTLFRRIGAIVTNASSQWYLFHQLGDEFLWDTPVVQLNNASSIQTTAVLVAVWVPPGLQVNSLIRGFISSSAANSFIFINSPDEASTAANTPVGNITADVPLTGTPAGAVWQLNVRTNASAQIRMICSTTTCTTTLNTYGWIDRRGRDA